MNELKEIKCTNCLYYDDIMMLEECKGCALSRSKSEEIIKFVKK